MPKTYVNISYNFMALIDADCTRYFWFQHRNTAADDAAVSTFMNDGARNAFLEDRHVLEQVHAGMKHAQTPHIDLGLDAGAKQFRAMLDRAIAAERSASAA